MEIDAIHQGHADGRGGKITEDAVFVHPIVSDAEVADQARELVLHEPLDAGVFDDVEAILRGCEVAAVDRGDCGLERLATGRSEERVSDFVTDEHIVELVGHVIPHGQGKHAILDIERSGMDVLMLNVDVLTGQETGENRLRIDQGIGERNGICRNGHTSKLP